MAVAPRTTIFMSMFEDFPEDARDERNRLFDTDHVPQRLSVPGFLKAERYELAMLPPSGVAATPGARTKGPPRYLNFYYIAGPEVITSEAYKLQAEKSSARGRRSPVRTKGELQREVWVKRPSPWERGTILEPAAGPKTLHIIAQAVEPGWEDRYNEFEDTVHIPQRLSCPGFLSCERFERADITIPKGARAADPIDFTYFTIYHTESPEVSTSPLYRAQSAVRGERDEHLRGHYGAQWRGVYIQRPSPWTVRPVPGSF